MDQDLRTCPGCGASAPDNSPCPYCGWIAERSEASQSAESPSHAETVPYSDEETEDSHMDLSGTDSVDHGEPQSTPDDVPPVQLRDLMNPEHDPDHLLDQVPEDMRAVLAARLKAAEKTESPGFNENTAAALRDQGYVVTEDARGARLSSTPGQSSDLSPTDVVKMAAELDGGVQPQTKLPICGKCEAASPIGDTFCQWCGEPFSNEQ